MQSLEEKPVFMYLFVYFSLVGERVSFDGRLLFPGLLVQSPCHDDGYVRVCLKIVLLFISKPIRGNPF